MKSLKFLNLFIAFFIFCVSNGFAQATRTKGSVGRKTNFQRCLLWSPNGPGTGKFPGKWCTTKFYPDYVKAYAIVKLAAAQANTDVGRMSKEKLAMIEKACQAIIDGKYHDQFFVDLYHGGAGTSANMNANEVLANIALEMSGHKKGEYNIIEPHDDLNMGQSTNDVYPTAIHVALLLHNDKVVKEAKALSASFHKKGDEFSKC